MRSLVALLLVASCGPPKAPPDVDAVSRQLYRSWPNSSSLVRALGDLETALARYDVQGALYNRSFDLTAPARDDLTDIAWPMDRDPARCIGVSVAWHSGWPVDDFARLQASPDQLAVEPSATKYQRTFVDPKDPSCFVDRGCAVIDTDNQVTRANTLYSMSFVMHKNFRWTELADGWAFVGRDFTDRNFPFDGGNGALHQSYSIDVFIARSDGTLRYQATWSETDLPIAVSGDLERETVASAVNDSLQAADGEIKKRWH